MDLEQNVPYGEGRRVAWAITVGGRPGRDRIDVVMGALEHTRIPAIVDDWDEPSVRAVSPDAAAALTGELAKLSASLPAAAVLLPWGVEHGGVGMRVVFLFASGTGFVAGHMRSTRSPEAVTHVVEQLVLGVETGDGLLLAVPEQPPGHAAKAVVGIFERVMVWRQLGGVAPPWDTPEALIPPERLVERSYEALVAGLVGTYSRLRPTTRHREGQLSMLQHQAAKVNAGVYVLPREVVPPGWTTILVGQQGATKGWVLCIPAPDAPIRRVGTSRPADEETDR